MPLPKEKGPFLICPKSNKIIGFRSKWLRWLYPIVGCVALVWHLIRVIPKPDRLAYPCQRVAAPLAWGFLGYLVSLAIAVAAWRKACQSFWRNRYVYAFGLLLIAVGAFVINLQTISPQAIASPWLPSDVPNTPIGTARGIHPGRVVWAYNPAAAMWSGSKTLANAWWKSQYTDQSVVSKMVSDSIQNVAGQSTDAEAWSAIFRYFNSNQGFGNSGYQAGEKIAIKINLNSARTAYTDTLNQVPTPQILKALLRELVNVVGVAQRDLYVYDGVRTIPPYLLDSAEGCLAEFPNVNFVDSQGALAGRTKVDFTNSTSSIKFSGKNPDGTLIASMKVPTCVANAKYLINLALLRGHTLAGVTLCAKNHFGSIPSPTNLHASGADRTRASGVYDCKVDLMGCKNLGAKTLLFMIDGLYGALHEGNSLASNQPLNWVSHPFRGGFSSSLFVSQDGVAIDSVAVDFLRSEPGLQSQVTGSVDGYLHEAALANNPPSGTLYAPNGDGLRLPSQGVHEHWNNATDKQYSRNLGTGNGIELVSLLSNNFSMDGAADSSQYQVGASGTAGRLYASLQGTKLYVAAPVTGADDQFLFVTDTVGQTGPAPWTKSGQVAFDVASKPYLAQSGTSKAVSWTNGGTLAKCSGPSTKGQMEGTIDLAEVFGSIPNTIHIACCKYSASAGGSLIPSSQIPAGNGDNTLGAGEFLAVPLSSIRDDSMGGIPNILQPGKGFTAAVSGAAGALALAWPTVPGHMYQVLASDDLSTPFQALSASYVAGQGEFNVSFSDSSASAVSKRFYRVAHLKTSPTLLCRFQFNGDAKDSGTKNLAMTANSVTYVPGGKEGSYSASFNGTNTMIQQASGKNPVAGSFSVAFWIKTSGTNTVAAGSAWPTGSGLVDGETGGVKADWGISITGDSIAFGIGGGTMGLDVTVTSPPINDGIWHHVTTTWDQALRRMIVYVDATASAIGLSDSNEDRTGASGLTIGRVVTGTKYFNGFLDDVQVYDQPLTPEDVSFLYNSPGQVVR